MPYNLFLKIKKIKKKSNAMHEEKKKKQLNTYIVFYMLIKFFD